MKLYLFFFQFFCLTIFTIAQSPVSINYDSKKGFKSDVSYTIFVDSRGFVWAAPEGAGVAYFDGNGESGFQHYTVKNGLCGNTLMTIYEDRNGNMWFGSQGYGLSVFDGKKFISYAVKDSVGLTNDIVTRFYQNSKGEMFAGVYQGGLVQFKDGKFLEIGDSTFRNIIIWSIVEDKNGVLWMSTHRDGLIKYDGEKMTAMSETLGLKPSLGLELIITKNGDILMATANGPVRIRDEKVIVAYNQSHGLPEGNNRANVRTLFEADNGDIYIVCSNRIWMLRDEKIKLIPMNGDLQYAPACFAKDKNGKIWYTSSTGGIVQLLDNGIEVISSPIADEAILACTYDEQGRLYAMLPSGIYENKYGFLYQLGEDFYANLTDVRGVVVRDTNNIFVLSGEHGINHLTRENNFALNHVSGYGVYDFERISDSVLYVLGSRGLYSFNLYTDVATDLVIMTSRDERFGVSFSMIMDQEKTIWMGRYDQGAIVKMNATDTLVYTSDHGLPNGAIIDLKFDKQGVLWFMSIDGHLGYKKGEQFIYFNAPVETAAGGFEFDDNGDIWVGNHFGILYLDIENYALKSFRQFNKPDGVDEGTTNFGKVYSTPDGKILVLKDGGNSYFIDPTKIKPDTEKPVVMFSGVYGKDNAILDSTWFTTSEGFFHIPTDLKLPYTYNNLTIQLKTIYFSQPDSLKYQYQLIGYDETWSKPQSSKTIVFTNLPAGEYQLNCKAIGTNHNESEIISLSFVVKTPYYQTWWFYISLVILVLIFIYLFVQWRLSVLRKDKAKLELIVEERTREVVQEKEHVQEKNKEILDSISYAKRIQAAILPPERIANEYLTNNFILYLPKDIVAGDFYWMQQVGENVLFAAADCTGHGVPGAMVSVVCNGGLNRSVREYKLTKPGQILDKARDLVIEEFEKSDDEVKDGMDISLCALNPITRQLLWAGANNPLWIIQTRSEKVELIELKADKQPIGKFANQKPFTTHQMQLEKGDVIYIFTDGYQDQFGGEKGKKFKASALKEFLLSIYTKPMDEQKEELKNAFSKWKGDLEQVDDVCLIGVQV